MPLLVNANKVKQFEYFLNSTADGAAPRFAYFNGWLLQTFYSQHKECQC